jgi:uncharacterized protein YdeI (YjbR/CyaY-like superfamily)
MSTESHPTLYVPTRAKWRGWLKKHHADTKEIWLVYYKKHTGKPSIPYDDAVEEAICFGWIDGLVKRLDDERYMQRFSPRAKSTKWSALNIRRAKAMIAQRLMTESGMAVFKTGKLVEAPPKNGFVLGATAIPADLQAALAKSKKAGSYFATLPPGYIRLSFKWITSAKKPETRIRRIAEFVSVCARGERLGMK